MPDNNLSGLGAVQARELIASGEISPVELLESCISRVKQLNPVVNALITESFTQARKAAKQAEQRVGSGEKLGALHGLPVAIKDIQNTAGILTTYGSKDLADFIPDTDAGIVARIRAAGGIIFGKTNVPEMSIGANTVNPLFGATGNPFNPELTCGGSSGGSGVVVATNMAPLATGSDHGGSLRIPACYSGVVGFRATPGVVPNEQRKTTQTYYSVQGPMARTVEDTSLLLSVISERDAWSRRDPMSFPLDAEKFRSLKIVDIGGLRVAFSADLGGVLVSESIRRTFEDRIESIAGMVGTCERHSVDLRSAPDVDWHLRQDVFVSQYFQDAAAWDQDFNPNIQATYNSALNTPMADIAQARCTQLELHRKFSSIFEEFDVFICPGVSVSPFPWVHMNPQSIDGQSVENYMAWLALTSTFTVVGHPVVALPCGLDEQGLPFGVQVVGRMYEDHRLLSIAHVLEQAFAKTSKLARPIPDFEQLSNMKTMKSR
ncbi:MAG: amidase [Pseudomonadales bacterium]|nr:amidase [Pseudomonadales bacterium]